MERWLAGLEGGESREPFFNGYRALVGDYKNVPEIDSGDVAL